MRILIVEPDETMELVLLRMCRVFNPKCVVVSIPNPSSANYTLDHESFDIVLATASDYASDALAVLRHARRCPNLIIIFMTDILGTHQREANRLGIDYCFRKGTSDMSRILTEAMSRVEQMHTT